MRPTYPVLMCALWWNCHVSVLTYHNDLSRTGQNLQETQLTPSSVSSPQFGPLFSYPVDGQVYAQPLYMPGVVVPQKGIHNVVFVATEHASVYAFDADNDLGAPLWHTNFLNASQGVTPASATDLECNSIAPEIGITGTPVIDATTGTLYVVAMTEEGTNRVFVHRLHALDVATGAERLGSPVEIQASVPGTGDGNTLVQFQPWLYKERAGLLLLNGTVYTAWSSQCDAGNYHGWIIGYRAWGYGSGSMQQTTVFTATPNWDAGAFWQAGAAPAADASGNIFVVSANGTFDANQGGSDFGESILKLSTAPSLAVADYFTPFNADALSDQDLDLGSSGALLLPEEAGTAAHPRLLVTGSKSGTVYLVDRDHLGHFHAGADSQIVQSLTGAVGPLFGIPVYFHKTVYFSAAQDQLKAFSVKNGFLSKTPVSTSSATFGATGSVPGISASGDSNGVLWTIDPSAELRAYDAADLGHQLYAGATGSYIKFSTPLIAGGKVYVGTAGSLAVFGLRDQTAASITAVVNADGEQSGPAADGSIVTLLGSHLAPVATSPSVSPWPMVLESTSVFINGVAAPIGYVSPSQIKVQVPSGIDSGTATVTVVVGGQVLPPIELTVSNAMHVK